MANKTVFALLFFVIAYSTFYSGIFIYNSSVDCNGKRFFLLFDDEMVSMRYAKNLAIGNGLVWNPRGEKIEGYSNLLWTLFMTVPHLLKIDISKTSLFMQCLGLVFMVLTMFILYESVIMAGFTAFSALAAVFLCGLSFSLTTWVLLGVEVSALAFFTVLSVYFYIRAQNDRRFYKYIYVVFGILIFLRFDMLFFAVLNCIYLIYVDEKNRKSHLIYAVAGILLPAAALTAFRFLYYGEFLPNTYYLKMTGYPLILRIARGIWSYVGMVIRGGVFLYIIPAAGVFFIKDKIYRYLIVLFCIQSLYSIYIGGDAWQNGVGVNRFIAVTLPVFFAAFAVLLQRMVDILKTHEISKNVLFFSVIIIISLCMNSYNGRDSIRQFALKEDALDVGLAKNRFIEAVLVKMITTKDALIGVYMAGVTPYFAERQYTDFLGKSDKYISRLKMQTPPDSAGLFEKAKFFYPGHLKTDYTYSVLIKKPDMFFGTKNRSNAIQNISKDKYRECFDNVYVSIDSKEINREILGVLMKDRKQSLPAN